MFLRKIQHEIILMSTCVVCNTAARRETNEILIRGLLEQMEDRYK